MTEPEGTVVRAVAVVVGAMVVVVHGLAIAECAVFAAGHVEATAPGTCTLQEVCMTF